MANQRIVLGDCLDVFANERGLEALVCDVPGRVGKNGFMGKPWDRAKGDAEGFSLMLSAVSKAEESELLDEYRFTKYWAIRYRMAYDVADQHAINIAWTLPRTSHLMANALRAAGWTIKDNLVHLFGTGWAKSGNALAPGQEGWLLATKGKPDLDIDACRVPRGAVQKSACGVGGYGGSNNAYVLGTGRQYDSLGSLPKNALLSHCEECVRVGVKSVSVRRSGNAGNGQLGVTFRKNGHGKPFVNHSELRDGTKYIGNESVPAWHCLAGCVCGARSKWDPEKPLPVCPCGETWQWWCAVAAVNEQSGNGGNNRMVIGGPDRVNAGVMASRYKSNAARDRSNAIMSFGDQGGASRFFNTFSYLSKCASGERHAGCENLYWRANKSNPFGFDQVTRQEWEAPNGSAT